MGEVYLERRRRFLIETQNADGGWGYFPGKASWLEPTAYALLALHRDPEAESARRIAWKLIESWQLADGSWRPGAQVQDGTWVTALAVTLASIDGRQGPMLSNGVLRLLRTEGSERSTWFRLMGFLGIGHIEVDTRFAAWPWRAGNSSWIEPTVHAIVALKKARAWIKDRSVGDRIAEGEEMILARRCADGGWNHGSTATYGVAAPSYPELTALALVALQGRRREAQNALARVGELRKSNSSPLANAWLAIAMHLWGENVASPPETEPARADVMLTALEMIAHPNGNHRLLRTEGV